MSIVMFEGKAKVWRRHHTADPAIEEMRNLGPHSFLFHGIDIRVHEDVWSPKIDWSGTRAVKFFPNLKGRRFLDIGCGSGIGCVAAILNGARSISGIDNNPSALRCSAENVYRTAQTMGALELTLLLRTNLSEMLGKFDYIYFNAPFHSDPVESVLHAAVSDPNYGWLKEVCSALPRLLSVDGELLTVFSESGDQKLFELLMSDAGLQLVESASETQRGYECSFYKYVQL